ncbi:MAG: peptidoglycan DD-metalloendopeptidase family protein [Candidatus Brocadiales bacterium]
MNVNIVKNIKWLILLVIIFSFTGCATVTPPMVTRIPVRSKPRERTPLHPPKVEKKPKAIEAPKGPEAAVYIVKRGDTVYRIAKSYGVTPQFLITTNHILDVRSLEPGQKIIIPGGKKTGIHIPPPRIRDSKRRFGTGKPKSGYLWPVRGEIISYYGDRKDGLRNTGMDIGAEPGEDVVAVKGGVVLTTTEGFGGGVVVIEHWRGLDSWYGHVGKILVNRGSKVNQGQVIAKVGTQHILHFKMFVDDRPVDPLKYLR